MLANARDQRLAFQYIDGAGNLLMKSLKGTLMRAIEVDILNTRLSITGPTTIEVFVGGYEGLDAPSIEIDFGDGQPPRVIDLASDPLPDGVSVTLQPPDGTSGSCDDVDVVCDGVIAIVNDFGAVGPNGVTITVTVRAIGAVGSDTAVLSRFCDPVGDASFPNADIRLGSSKRISKRFRSVCTSPTTDTTRPTSTDRHSTRSATDRGL